MIEVAVGLPDEKHLAQFAQAVGALLVVEALNGIPRYGGLAAVSCINGLLVLRWPQLRTLLVNLNFTLLVVGSFYFRLQPRGESREGGADA